MGDAEIIILERSIKHVITIFSFCETISPGEALGFAGPQRRAACMGSKEYKKSLKIQRKVGLLRPKTMPRHILNNSKRTLKKSRKRLFWPSKWSKMTPPNRKMSNLLNENFDFKGHLSTFRAENTPKVGLLRSKTVPKHFPNNSKTTLKKSRKRLFRPPKRPKMTPIERQNKPIFDWIFLFSRSFINLSSWIYAQK